jgi:hypothetical protein
MYYKELVKYLKKDVGNPQSMYINAIASDPNNAPMAKVMKEYFEIGLGDLINDLINHKRKPFWKRRTDYHKELERIYIKMINVLVSLNDFNFDNRF